MRTIQHWRNICQLFRFNATWQRSGRGGSRGKWQLGMVELLGVENGARGIEGIEICEEKEIESRGGRWEKLEKSGAQDE